MYSLSSTCQIPNLDKIYLKYFGQFTNNRMFVEIGAHDGESVSNTSCLADAGWKGIYVEPIYSNYVKCLERHKKNNIIVSNISIGLEEGIQKIYVNDILSSLDYDHALLGVSKFNYPEYTEDICYQQKMETFLKNYNIPYDFDLLVVDVEGKEHEVFYSFNMDKWSPKMIIVELMDDHEYIKDDLKLINKIKHLRYYIEKFNYTEIYRDEINTVFVKNDFV